MRRFTFKDQVEGCPHDMEFFPKKWGPFKMCYYEIQPNDGTKYEIMVGWNVGGMHFPRAGDDYHLVVYNTGWYLFHDNEFDRVHDGNIKYVSEKLHCSSHTAKIIITFMKNIRAMQAKMILSEVEKEHPLIENASFRRDIRA